MERDAVTLPDQLYDIRHQFIATIAPFMGVHGISETHGRLYGTMLFASKPMTLDDMSEALGMSKMSMSTGVRGLMDMGMVERVWEKGVRKDLYKPHDDWYHTFTSVFTKRWRPAIESNKQAALQAQEALIDLQAESKNSSWADHVDQDIQLLQEALNYYDWVEEVIRLFESGAIYDIVPPRATI